ncbi:MAG: hypothetical protein ABEJ76_01180 [Halanaeroarchaeum sp.]
MSSSAARGQVEPLPALVAVSALVAALGVYAGAFHQVPTGTERPIAREALAHEVGSATRGGILDPRAIRAEPPRGYRMRTTVRVADRHWQAGPAPPDGAETATRTVLVATDEGERVGRIRVWVWR